MKHFYFLFVLFAGASLTLSACGDDEGNEKGALGSVTFDGKRIAMKAPIFEENNFENTDKRVFTDRWKAPETGNEIAPIKTYVIGITSTLGTNADPDKAISLCFITSLLQTDFTIDLSSFSTEYCHSVCFNTEDKYYFTPLSAVRYFTNPKTRLSIIGIDPETGLETLPERDNTFVPIWDSHEIGFITGGSLSVKWKSETVRLDFNLKLDDGKTAKGYGEIPREMIVL